MSTPKHILVVDDVRNMRDLLSAILEDAGYEVTQAPSIVEMNRQICGDKPIDLVLLDINLTDGSGIKAAANLKHVMKEAAPPICYVSGERDQQIVSGALAAGGLEYIVKPIEPPILLEKIDNILKGSTKPVFTKVPADLPIDINDLPFECPSRIVELGESDITIESPVKFKLGTVLKFAIPNLTKTVGLSVLLICTIHQCQASNATYRLDCKFQGLADTDAQKIRQLVFGNKTIDGTLGG